MYVPYVLTGCVQVVHIHSSSRMLAFVYPMYVFLNLICCIEFRAYINISICCDKIQKEIKQLCLYCLPLYCFTSFMMSIFELHHEKYIYLLGLLSRSDTSWAVHCKINMSIQIYVLYLYCESKGADQVL